MSNAGSTISISDLYALVKTYDKKFSPKPVNPALLNEDGTPLVVYHGTDADFTVFDRTKGRSNMDIQGMFFSPWEIDAQGYGPKVGAYYINLKNPADEGTAFKALNMFQGQNGAGIKARDYLIKQGYDGVNNSGEEFIAFYPEQIKSATDNIGTFDSDNPDIRYSERGNGYDGYAMSNNARDAYERGEMPLSRWTKQKVINQIAQDNGVSPEDVSLEFPYEHYLEKAGWHHTSSKYNKTYFYYVTDDTSGVIFSERAKEKIQSDKIEQVKKYLEENKENLKKAEAWKPEITEDDQYYYIRELDNRNGIYNKNYTTKEKVILRTEEKVQEKISYLKQRIENQEKQIRDLSNSENFRYSTRAERLTSKKERCIIEKNPHAIFNLKKWAMKLFVISGANLKKSTATVTALRTELPSNTETMFTS